jgi:MinD-like ATPase involved in chromosome partitioning or flagellar assembly
VIRARVVTVAGNPGLEALVAERLAVHESCELLLRCVDRAELLGAIRGGRLDAVVTVGLPPWVDAQTLEEARRRTTRVVVIDDGMVDSDRVRRFGLRVLDGHDADAIVAAIESSERPPSPSEPAPSADGRVVAVWGPKGAPGRTSIALELAAQLAATEPATLLVDGDGYGGDVVQLAGIVEELPTIVWAARMAAKDELDPTTLAAELRRAGTKGPVLLPGLPRADLWAEVSDFGWRRLLAHARATFAFTVCDTGFCLEPDPSPYPEAGEGRNRLARVALAEADRVIAVCRADAVGLKQFAWGFEALRGLVDPESVIVVVNRVRTRSTRELRDLLRRHVGKSPLAFVPEHVPEWRRAVEAGKSLHEMKAGSDVSNALRPVVAALGGTVAPRGFLMRLGGRR